MSAELPENFTAAQCELYGRMYRFLLVHQEDVKHPGAPALPEDQWQSLCHNVAMLASTMSGGDELVLCDPDGGPAIFTTEESAKGRLN